MKVTIGGDRLGSGNKQKTALRNYERSTHNLNQKFTSSMQVGTLYPFLVLPAMRGDKFDIDLAADARTIPTKGPLFGSFKMQIDLFQCDVRLYQAILHNNPLAIGLNMNQVKFPVLDIADDKNPNAFSNSCLLKYLGMSGIGHNGTTIGANAAKRRRINAIPALAYYEIFKTYYANKQEQYAYTIANSKNISSLTNLDIYDANEDALDFNEAIAFSTAHGNEQFIELVAPTQWGNAWKDKIIFKFLDVNDVVIATRTLDEMLEKGETSEIAQNKYHINYVGNDLLTIAITNFVITYANQEFTYTNYELKEFDLSNIDDMRLKLLSHHTLGTAFMITNTSTENEEGKWGRADGVEENGLPYINLVDYKEDEDGNYTTTTKNVDALNGLVIKTYQADIYNTWVNTEWIDGENGIANVTAIAVSDGKIKIDSINFSEKLYNMLNRVAVSDGSYEGWQDAVYTETPKRHIESPVYLGGMSSEIVFEEIVQTSQGDEDNPLGTLAGKGRLLKRKGGHVTVKCNEACFIIGIVSLTPRINYTQGNEFYLTDLLSMDDYHKPALDGIGFQNLIAERMAWWTTGIDQLGVIKRRQIVGKVPAWIEYMTAVDKCYGDFAETNGYGFMALQRNYTRSSNGEQIEDATTYIDPRKYNYAFAYTDLDAQNFWVQIQSNIKARRLMSAKQIPNI